MLIAHRTPPSLYRITIDSPRFFAVPRPSQVRIFSTNQLEKDQASPPHAQLAPRPSPRFLLPEPPSHSPDNKFQLDHYLRLRHGDPDALARLPTRVVTKLADEAFCARNTIVLDAFVSDLIRIDHNLLPDKINLIEYLFKHESLYCSLSENALQRLLYHYLSLNGNNIDQIPVSMLHSVAKILLHEELSNPGRHQRLLNSLTPSLLATSSPHAVIPQAGSSQSVVSDHGKENDLRLSRNWNWALYRYIMQLLETHSYQRASDLFQRLLDTGRLAHGSLFESDSQKVHGKAAVRRIILGAFIRSCLQWKWFDRAAFILEALSDQECRHSKDHMHVQDSEVLRNLATEILSGAVEGVVGKSDLEKTAAVLLRIATGRFGKVIHANVYDAFYRRAYQLDSPNVATQTYCALVDFGESVGYKFPLPTGQPLSWLLTRLLSFEHDMGHGRILAHHILENGQSISRDVLPNIIMRLAKHGFIRVVKDMWFMRAQLGATDLSPEDRQTQMFVLSSPMIMRGIVSLFYRIAYKKDGLASTRAFKSSRVIEDDDLDESAQQYLDFVKLVISKFAQSWMPLEDAPRSALNALSRAYFTLGNVDEGLSTLRILLSGRKEYPTRRELGVVLAGMASISPRRAARVLHMMSERGIQPQSSDFSCILHEASRHGDSQLVGAIVKRLRASRTQLTTQGMHSLVRASIRFTSGSRQERPGDAVQTLHRVLRMIRSVRHLEDVATPWTGAVCIEASLRANEIELGYQFWELLVREKEKWELESQRHLREELGSAIRRELHYGRLREERGRWMLQTLRMEGPLGEDWRGERKRK